MKYISTRILFISAVLLGVCVSADLVARPGAFSASIDLYSFNNLIEKGIPNYITKLMENTTHNWNYKNKNSKYELDIQNVTYKTVSNTSSVNLEIVGNA